MNATRLAWPEDRRLFRRARKLVNGYSAFALLVAAALIAALGWGSIA